MANKRSLRRRKSNRRLKGGAGGADYAIATYGGMGQQHAAPSLAGGNENNVIAMNGGIKGGRRKKGGNITDLAVPAVLLVANHMYKRRGALSTMRYRGSRKSRRNFSRKVRGGNKPINGGNPEEELGGGKKRTRGGNHEEELVGGNKPINGGNPEEELVGGNHHGKMNEMSK